VDSLSKARSRAADAKLGRLDAAPLPSLTWSASRTAAGSTGLTSRQPGHRRETPYCRYCAGGQAGGSVLQMNKILASAGWPKAVPIALRLRARIAAATHLLVVFLMMICPFPVRRTFWTHAGPCHP
jgi:hypothetical protein